jgi:hypothetical protein
MSHLQDRLHHFLSTHLHRVLPRITRELARHSASLPTTTLRTLADAADALHTALPHYAEGCCPRPTVDTYHHARLLSQLLRHTPGLPVELAEVHRTLASLLS